MELRTDLQERMASEYAKMVQMMREQRDGFRIPRDKGGLGAAHSDEARHCCAELLEWFLISYDPRPMATPVRVETEKTDAQADRRD